MPSGLVFQPIDALQLGPIAAGRDFGRHGKHHNIGRDTIVRTIAIIALPVSGGLNAHPMLEYRPH